MENTLARMESEMKEVKEKLVSLTASAGESKNKGQPLGRFTLRKTKFLTIHQRRYNSHVDVGIKLRTMTNPGSVFF